MAERRETLTGLDLTVPGALERWFGGAPWGLAIVDRGLRFARVNAALAEIDGVPVDEHAGRSVGDVLPGLSDRLESLLRRVLGAGEAITAEELLGRTRADPGHDRRFALSCFPLRRDDGTVQAAAAMLLRLPEKEGELDVRLREQRMRLAMEGTGTGFWEWDVAADGVGWTDSLAPLHGLAAGRVPDGIAGYLALVHPDDRAATEAALRAAVDTRGDYICEFRTLQPGGSERWLASRGRAIVDEDGRGAVLVGLTAEVTERRRREDALTFLAEAGNVLTGSLDPVQTLNEIAHLAVPRLADWCTVQLAAEAGGRYDTVAVAHVDPGKVRWARELQERYPTDPDGRTGSVAVIRTGRSELYPEIDERLLEAAARDPEHLALIRQLRMRSAMVVPLRARDRTLGAITFIYAESGRQYSTHELELAEELGRRAGLALDHARLYDREHRTAETLQLALLPPTLPAIAGHEIAARYLPGLEGDHVGGDWYDAFALPGGRIGIAIGDIGGRGIAAAALMGQIRNALRAYAIKVDGPAAVTADLRALGDRLEGLDFATLTYIAYDPATGEAVLSSLGHLPTLIRAADGTTRFTNAPRCPPLGATADAPCPEHAFTLDPGATLVLYTDGLVESRQRSLETGLERLARAASATRGDVQRLVDHIVEALPDQRQDDIALLALRRSG